MSMNRADLYGMLADSAVSVQPTSVAGPNQGAVAPASGAAPGNFGSNTPGSASFTWVGFILALVILRIVIDLGGRDRD